MDDLRPFLSRRPDGRCRLMGVLNVTPDSFHAASRVDLDSAIEQGMKMWAEGADWIDVGGESTRPGAEPVDSSKEMARVTPVIEALRNANPTGLISIDSRRVDVARAALDAGANMINDVSGLRNPEMESLVLERGCAVCIMHMQGEPGNIQQNPNYDWRTNAEDWRFQLVACLPFGLDAATLKAVNSCLLHQGWRFSP